MKAVGIVAEYNPFHLGHEYHIMKTKELHPDKGIIAVMSGDFVQRGQAAIFDKHVRAKAAVMGGVDLVIELPLPWAVASAEGFARGAVGLLASLGVVDRLSFGSESGDVSLLEELAAALDSSEIDGLIAGQLKSGAPYAAARQSALETVLGDRAKAISAPNNILGVEYIRALKAIKSDVLPVTVSRKGAGHDEHTEEAFRSASQIRHTIWSGQAWADCVPKAVYDVLRHEEPIDELLMERAVLSRLRRMSAGDIAKVPDCSEGLENRIYSAIQTESSLDGILSAVKTRRYAMSRLRRMLICAALGVEKGMSSGTPPYARVLAANETGIALLGEIKKTATLPIITKPAHGLKLEKAAGECFRLTASARAMYTLGKRANLPPDSDLRSGPYLLK